MEIVDKNKLLREHTKHLGFGIIGCAVSLVYLIIASVYHFFMPGFGFAMFGLITSVLYTGFTSRDFKKIQHVTGLHEEVAKSEVKTTEAGQDQEV